MGTAKHGESMLYPWRGAMAGEWVVRVGFDWRASVAGQSKIDALRKRLFFAGSDGADGSDEV